MDLNIEFQIFSECSFESWSLIAQAGLLGVVAQDLLEA